MIVFKVPKALFLTIPRILILVLLLGALSSLSVPTQAAGSADANPEGTVSRLTDEEVRRLLLEHLNKETAPTETGFNPAITAWRLQGGFGIIRREIATILAAAPELPGIFPRVLKILNEDRGKEGMGRFLVVFLVALLLGGLVEFALRRGLARRSREVAARQPSHLGARARALGFLLVLDSLGAAVFIGAAVAAYFVLAEGDGWFRTTFVFYMTAVAMVRFVVVGARFFLAPDHPNLRIPLFSDAQAKLLHRATMVTIVLGSFGFFSCALFAVLGIGGDVHTLLLILVGTVTTVSLMVSLIRGRQALATDISLGDEADVGLRSLVARSWPWTFAATIALIWIGIVITALLDRTPLYGAALFTIFLLMVAPSVESALEREARRRIAVDEEVWPAILRAARIGLMIVLVFLLASAWRIDLVGLTGQGLGGQVAGALLQVSMVVLVTYILWQAARIWIDRRIAVEDKVFADAGIDISEMEIGGTGLSRIRTLLPLIKRSIQITLSIIAFTIILSALGVNIGPVLAGAGVVGLAIGFGSQALVRDIVSGVFFLLDDAFRLGEYVDVGAVKGSVEKISIRSFQLRHHRGAVNTVPFGEIHTLANYSRDWAIMKLRFRISFGTDIEKVRKVLKKVGQKLLEHPEIGEDFIQPFKSQGVLEIDDYGLVVRAKFMSKPGRQFVIRRYAYMAVQKAFAENGIEFARPEIKVVTDDDDEEVAGAAMAASKQKMQGAAAMLQKGAAEGAS